VFFGKEEGKYMSNKSLSPSQVRFRGVWGWYSNPGEILGFQVRE
jgi:hypothetical protein